MTFNFIFYDILDIQELKNVHLHERHKRATGEYQLELLIVVDFSIYS